MCKIKFKLFNLFIIFIDEKVINYRGNYDEDLFYVEIYVGYNSQFLKLWTH